MRHATHVNAAGCLGLAILLAVFTSCTASATSLPQSSLGVNFTPLTSHGRLVAGDLSMAEAAGVGLARAEINQGTDADALIASLANLHLRLYPILGLPSQLTPLNAATAMAEYVTAFAQRYGPTGTFWSENRNLPYQPVTSFEIGNEPNIPLQWVADDTHLHWSDPSAYAAVYAASRAALHQADPSGLAVVGGLADTGGDGVDLTSAERWLGALTPNRVDAVGYHLYLAPSSLEPDTEALRQWMNTHGLGNVPIDVNEIGACDVTPLTTMNTGCPVPTISSTDWGAVTRSFMTWALCTPGLRVESYQPEYWGDVPTADVNAILPLVDSDGDLTPYGVAYLNQTSALTTFGCPPLNVTPPAITGEPVSGQTLAATTGTWSTPAVAPLAYQWQRCDAAGTNCENVAGAISEGYQAEAVDVGATLVVTVTATNGAGSGTGASAPTQVIAAPDPTGGGGGSPPPGSSGPSGGAILSTSPATASGTSTRTSVNRLSLAPTRLTVLALMLHGRTVTIRASVDPSGGLVLAVASDGRQRIALRRSSAASSTARLGRVIGDVRLLGNLPAGRWTITISGLPPPGYAAPRSVRRSVVILPASGHHR